MQNKRLSFGELKLISDMSGVPYDTLRATNNGVRNNMRARVAIDVYLDSKAGLTKKIIAELRDI
ncbi:hypothetical protein SAMN04515674_101513 [Pseudarcicella hirudinis]|uniref:Uncharacterized protein n=1 Tax=Pseudarcicella hirudinis TaxID=1079859 RepID=A0A1I5MZ02_9BACT|nr:hypothetical protein [Pseudarcicella hirudinis]SFP14637.1 hypothetical protein SAMN04515674_101513 [Pseudarcicella hirudinis]